MRNILFIIVCLFIICVSCKKSNVGENMNENTAYIEQLQVDTSNKKVYYSQKILDEYKKIDSMLAARSKSKIKLSFMGYELGKSYSNAKGERKKLLEKNITRLEISHYDDTIYQIRAKIEDYKNENNNNYDDFIRGGIIYNIRFR